MGRPTRKHRKQEPEPSPGVAPGRPASRHALPLLLAAVLTAGVVAFAHWPVLDSQGLALDDIALVQDNPLITSPGWTSTARFFTEVLNPSTFPSYYFPIPMTSLMLDYALGGRITDLRVFHRTNLALHILNTVLILLILHRLFGALLPAAATALMFGLHPLAVEPIASIGERKTLLAAFFAFSCVLCYVQHARRRGRAWWIAAIALFALALLSKPSVTALPLLLLVLDYWPLRRLSWSTVVEKWPLVLLSLVMAVITVMSVARTWQFGTPPPTGSLKSMLQICYLLAFYLGKIVWPTNLTPVYPPPQFSLDERVVLLSLITVCGLLLPIALSLRRTRAPLAGSLFFVVALAPTFGILRWSLIIAYDRYLYFPMLGLVLLLGSGLATAWRSRALQRPALKGALLALLLIATAGEVRCLRATLSHWRDSVTIWRHIEALAPQIPEAHNGLGAALLARNASAEAIQQFRRAVELDPGYPFAQFNLGYVLSQLGRAEEAIPHLRRTYMLMPGSPSAALQLGIAEQHAGRLDDAEEHLRRALAIKPGYQDAVDQLAVVLVLQGRTDEGIALMRSALALPPDDARPAYSLAAALLRTQKHDAEALDLLRRAIRLKPDWAAPYDDVAWLLATNADASLRNPPEALRFADRVVEITGGRNASALDTQAAALAAVGQFDRAVQTARRALSLAPQDTADMMVRAIRERLAMYERRVAYIEPVATDSAPVPK